MSEDRIKHRLAALLSADVVGYSRLMTNDEAATIRTRSAYRDKMTSMVAAHEGRLAVRENRM